MNHTLNLEIRGHLSQQEVEGLNLIENEEVLDSCTVSSHQYILTNKRLFLKDTLEEWVHQARITDLISLQSQKVNVSSYSSDDIWFHAKRNATLLSVALYIIAVCFIAWDNGEIIYSMFIAIMFGYVFVAGGIIGGVATLLIMKVNNKTHEMHQFTVFEKGNAIFSDYNYDMSEKNKIVTFERVLNSKLLDS